ncbi:hypothetical protein XENORESO_022120 [Xenotaenia resolanae]|uniref:Uncharacterized protein n=1 Tax=Xenotaenia resolanae TaxID=208358 RepID=A0ABV0W5S6_9TELE
MGGIQFQEHNLIGWFRKFGWLFFSFFLSQRVFPPPSFHSYLLLLTVYFFLARRKNVFAVEFFLNTFSDSTFILFQLWEQRMTDKHTFALGMWVCLKTRVPVLTG